MYTEISALHLVIGLVIFLLIMELVFQLLLYKNLTDYKTSKKISFLKIAGYLLWAVLKEIHKKILDIYVIMFDPTYNAKNFIIQVIIPLAVRISIAFFRSSQYLSKMYSSLQYLIPKKYREEWVGDLTETWRKMRKEGFPVWWCVVVHTGQIVTLGVALFRIKLSDAVSPFAKQTDKAE